MKEIKQQLYFNVKKYDSLYRMLSQAFEQKGKLEKLLLEVVLELGFHRAEIDKTMFFPSWHLFFLFFFLVSGSLGF
jgi:hypothetical protein